MAADRIGKTCYVEIHIGHYAGLDLVDTGEFLDALHQGHRGTLE